MKKHSEKTEDARPKREQRKREKAGERASGGTRKSAALSRLVSKGELARLARARKFVPKIWHNVGMQRVLKILHALLVTTLGAVYSQN